METTHISCKHEEEITDQKPNESIHYNIYSSMFSRREKKMVFVVHKSHIAPTYRDTQTSASASTTTIYILLYVHHQVLIPMRVSSKKKKKFMIGEEGKIKWRRLHEIYGCMNWKWWLFFLSSFCRLSFVASRNVQSLATIVHGFFSSSSSPLYQDVVHSPYNEPAES